MKQTVAVMAIILALLLMVSGYASKDDKEAAKQFKQLYSWMRRSRLIFHQHS